MSDKVAIVSDEVARSEQFVFRQMTSGKRALRKSKSNPVCRQLIIFFTLPFAWAFGNTRLRIENLMRVSAAIPGGRPPGTQGHLSNQL